MAAAKKSEKYKVMILFSTVMPFSDYKKRFKKS